MKSLNADLMIIKQGGKLTNQEIEDFLGASGCVLMGTGAGALFGGAACVWWISSWF
jgi:hypothetical protein